MKKTLVLSLTFFVMGILAISNLTQAEQVIDKGLINEPVPALAIQEGTPSAPQEIAPTNAPAAPAAIQEESPSDGPTPVVPGSVLEGLIVDAPLVAPMPYVQNCGTCCHSPCCCPIPTEICLVEPLCCCEFEICVNLPPCCIGQAPVVSWREGILGRQIAILCWPCCDKRVKVVLPVFGGPRVFE